MNILIADDDPDDREFLFNALTEINPKVNCMYAEDGVAVIDILQGVNQLPDFIFLDINMPKMTGVECLIEIKKYKKLKHVPVIILSTTIQQDHIDQFMALGAHKYVHKPNFYEHWVESIRQVLRS